MRGWPHHKLHRQKQGITSDRHANKLHLRHFFDRVSYAFTANAAVFHAAKGIIIQAEAGRFVDPQCTNVKFVREAKYGGEVAREHRTLQPEWRVICEFKGLIDGFESRHERDRAKYLFPPQTGLARNSRENA